MEFLSILSVQALHSIVDGMLLFLVASGLTLIFGMMWVLNFAHGALYILRAYFSLSILQCIGGLWLSILIAPFAVVTISIIIERFV